MKGIMISGLRVLIALIAFCATAASAVIFTEDTFINFSNTNYDGQEIVVTNCTLTVNGTHNFQSLLIQSGGVVTHSFTNNGLMQDAAVFQQWFSFTNTNTVYLLQNNILTNSILVVDAGFTTNYTNGLDYEVFDGTNGVEIVRTIGSSIPEDQAVAVLYQALTNLPINLELIVEGNVTVEAGGAINAKGKGFGGGSGPGAGRSQTTNIVYTFTAGSGGGHGGFGGASASQAAGGSGYGTPVIPIDKGSGGGTGAGPGGSGGGAIKISAGGELKIDGVVSADGSDGTNSHSGGGAGGGIWFIATTFTGAGTVSANGGRGEPFNGGGGGGGRIALQFTTNQFTGTITAKGGSGSTYGGAGSVYTVGPVGKLSFNNGGIRGAGSPLAMSSMDLTISEGAVVQLTNSSISARNILIQSNGWLGHVSPLQTLTVSATGFMTIESGGGVDVDGTGFGSSAGSGFGRNLNSTGSGGGYGGYGGNSSSNAVGGTSYGTFSGPTDRGSGGGTGYTGSFGGAGGGALKLTVTGPLTVNGKISANGNKAVGIAAGGGSGGSVWLDVGSLVGTGAITADGGDGDLPNGGGGGGGRIYVRYGTNVFAGRIAAYGGKGANNGSAGSIYTLAKSNTKSEIIIDGGGSLATDTLLSMTSSTPHDLTVRGGAKLRYTPYGSLYQLGNLFIDSNSWLTATSTNNASLSLIFSNATILEGGGITLDGLGYPSGGGTGYGTWQSFSSTYSGAGAGHGGLGGSGALTTVTGGISYGSAIDPNTSGSGGGGISSSGGSGGGVLRLTVNGTLDLRGRLSADGKNGAASGSGGGAGGSIYVSADRLIGGGIISANGGAGDLPNGGGGGGGRIAIFTDTNSFTGTITARGGSGLIKGGAGTCYIKSTPTAMAVLTIDNGGVRGANTIVPWASGTYYDLHVTGSAMVVPTNGISNLTVESNSWLLLTNLALVVTNNARIASGCGIDVDGKATSPGIAPGGTSSSGTPSGGGGGHGGAGGASLFGGAGGNYYSTIGSPTQPVTGGSVGGYYGGAGGGVIRFTVNRTLDLDGKISAAGAAGLTNNSGGGAGGSIWLTVGTLTGNGTISANGGSGELPVGGGGGGGRIAIEYATNSFAGTISTRGGAGANYGGAGTIYLKPNNQSVPLLVIDNGGFKGALTIAPNNINGLINLIVTNAAEVMPYTLQPIVNLVIGPGSSMVPGGSPANLTMTVSNATIHAGGSFSMDGMGYYTGSNPGTGSYANFGSGYTRGGGAYGGYGGASALGVPGGTPHGSVSAPTSIGANSGGDSYSTGGAGGGALKLTVNGTLKVDGKLSADGAIGGGSGGSVWLVVGTLTGTGTISSAGGIGESPYGGGGGGGRIAIYYSTNTFSGVVSAHGGTGANNGGAGTIYTKANNKAVAEIVVDAGGVQSGNTLLSSQSFSGPYDLTIRSGTSVIPGGNATASSVYISSNAWLVGVSNSTLTLTVTSNVTIEAGGGINLNGKGSSSNQGTGPTTSTSPYGYVGAGGSHGGYGGRGAGMTAGANQYGLVTSPSIYTGSSGGNGGGLGGGSISLTVNGILTNGGSISADGNPGLAISSGGGAGGSIQLNVGRLVGSGSISAKGGNADLPYGGGGGGGRIAVQYGTNSFAGEVTARGGIGFNSGSAGTIYYKPNSSSYGHVIIDNGGIIATNTALPSLNSINLTVRGSSEVQPVTSGQTIGTLVIQNNSSLTFISNQSFTLTVYSNATIQAGGRIDMSGKGTSGGTYSSTGFLSGNGGGHGGIGGLGIGGNTPGASTGSILTPTTFGGGGGVYPQFGSGAAGGGAVRLTVNQTLRVDGTIIADGSDAVSQNGGGGAGGSIWITTGSLTGNGWISANGGSGETPYGGGGGGGRVALHYGTNNFNGDITAWGGIGYVTGGAGTIYKSQTGNPVADVIVANGGWRGTNTPVTLTTDMNLIVSESAIVHPTSSELFMRNLEIASQGEVTHLANQTNVSLIVVSNALIHTNGVISADGKGYTGSNPGPGAGTMLSPNSGGGGGHGGAGGASASGSAGGIAYGSAQQPTDRGSRGGTGGSHTYSDGGGVVRMQVGGNLIVNGKVSANGNAAILDRSGGGAGGSIWLTAGRLEGNGFITANGGAGEPAEGGGGAGGRIAIYARTNSFVGGVIASGAQGASWGENGTVFYSSEFGMQLLSQSPTGAIAQAVSFVTLTFNSPLTPSSPSLSEVTITTPNGTAAPITASLPNSTSIRLNFPQQTAVGNYEIRINELSDVFGNPLPSPYIGTFTIVPLQLTGALTNSAGLPMSGVPVEVSAGVSSTVTDANGNFAIQVPPLWTGSVTPVTDGLTFVPSSRNYTNLTVNLANQNFIGVTQQELTMTTEVSGTNMNLNWAGVSGLSYTVMSSTNLQSWFIHSGPYAGTNGPMGIALPVNSDPTKYFRLDLR